MRFIFRLYKIIDFLFESVCKGGGGDYISLTNIAVANFGFLWFGTLWFVCAH